MHQLLQHRFSCSCRRTSTRMICLHSAPASDSTLVMIFPRDVISLQVKAASAFPASPPQQQHHRPQHHHLGLSNAHVQHNFIQKLESPSVQGVGHTSRTASDPQVPQQHEDVGQQRSGARRAWIGEVQLAPDAGADGGCEMGGDGKGLFLLFRLL